MENLSKMDDTTIINHLFAIAVEECKSELTLQDEQDYQGLDWELSSRRLQ